MPSLCILSAAWRRFDVTRLVLEQRRRLCEELASRGMDAGMLIVADDENLDIAGEYGAATVEAPNKPLGGKWNAGLLAAADSGADWIVWVGSDDWIHPAVFDPIIDREESAPPVIFSGHRLAIVDMAAGSLQRIETPSPYGAIPWILDGRLIRDARHRRHTGEHLGLLEPKVDRGLDGALIKALRRGRVDFRWQYHDPTDFRCVDFKTRTNITPFEGLARNLAVCDREDAWDALREQFPADLVQKAADLSESLFEGVAA